MFMMSRSALMRSCTAPREPKAALDPVSDRAIERLKELGATAFEQESGLLVDIQYGWKGTDADLDLLADVADINQLDLDLDAVGAEAIGKLTLKLKRPVESLALSNLSDERVAALKHLPPCKHLVLPQQTLSAEGFSQLAKLAEGVESLLPALTGGIDDERLASIGKIRSLKKLDLQMAEITDAGLAHLASLDKLEELWLMGCVGIHGPGYANLAPVQSLRTLKIYMPVDAEGFRASATLTQLTKLELWPDASVAESPDQEPAGVEALKGLANLRSLEVTTNRGDQPTLEFCDAVLQVAAQMPELRSLRVLNLDTDAGSLAGLTGCPQLEELFLGQITLNDPVLATFDDLKNLKKLRLMSNGEVAPAIWEKLGRLQPLVGLWANHSGVDDSGLSQLAGLTGLEGLNLSGSKITGTGLRSLTNFKQLKTLTLSESPLDDEGGALLRNFPAIEFLDLSKTKITDRSLDAIAALPNLRTLTLDGTQVTADGLMKLRELQQLSRISVRGIKPSFDEMKRLRAAFPEVVIEVTPPPNGTTGVFVPGPKAAAEEPDSAVVSKRPQEPQADAPPLAIGRMALPTNSAFTSKGQDFPHRRSTGPQAANNPAAERALKRLTELGAAGDASQIFIVQNWKGTAADLDLLNDLPHLELLSFNLADVNLNSIGKLKLKRPVEVLLLHGVSDQRLARLANLPTCVSLRLAPFTLSAKGCRHFARLAQGVEYLQVGDGLGDDPMKWIGQIRSLRGLLYMAGLSPGSKRVITDDGLSQLDGLERLEELMLVRCAGIRGPGYASLARAKSLRLVSICEAPIDAALLAGLAQLTQIRELNLESHDFPPAGLKPADFDVLKNLSSLQFFEIRTQGNDANLSTFGDAILAAAGKMPRLRQLIVRDIGADADGVEALAAAPRLESLLLEPVAMSDRSLKALAALKNLKKLGLLNRGVLTAPALAQLAKLHKTTTLSLLSCGLDDNGLAQLAPLRALESLDLRGNEFAGGGLKSLTLFDQLKSLDLSETPLEDVGGEALGNFPAIESLDLSKTKVTDRSLEAIATLQNLQTLSLNDTRVTASGLMKLRGLKQLGQISVAGIQSSAADMARLRAAMPEVTIDDKPFDMSAYRLDSADPE